MTEQKNGKNRATRKSEAVAIVQVMQANGDGEMPHWYDTEDGFISIAEAQRWINDSGEEGNTYRIVRAWPAVKVTIETNPRRTVTPA